jgi:hypothetical protein
MAKSDNQSHTDYPTTPPYQDQSALVTAIKDLTAAITASRVVTGPSDAAKSAGLEYAQIKSALRRYSDTTPETGAATPATGSSRTGKYE